MPKEITIKTNSNGINLKFITLINQKEKNKYVIQLEDIFKSNVDDIITAIKQNNTISKIAPHLLAHAIYQVDNTDKITEALLKLLDDTEINTNSTSIYQQTSYSNNLYNSVSNYLIDALDISINSESLDNKTKNILKVLLKITDKFPASRTAGPQKERILKMTELLKQNTDNKPNFAIDITSILVSLAKKSSDQLFSLFDNMSATKGEIEQYGKIDNTWINQLTDARDNSQNDEVKEGISKILAEKNKYIARIYLKKLFDTYNEPTLFSNNMNEFINQDDADIFSALDEKSYREGTLLMAFAIKEKAKLRIDSNDRITDVLLKVIDKEKDKMVLLHEATMGKKNTFDLLVESLSYSLYQKNINHSSEDKIKMAVTNYKNTTEILIKLSQVAPKPLTEILSKTFANMNNKTGICLIVETLCKIDDEEIIKNLNILLATLTEKQPELIFDGLDSTSERLESIFATALQRAIISNEEKHKEIADTIINIDSKNPDILIKTLKNLANTDEKNCFSKVEQFFNKLAFNGDDSPKFSKEISKLQQATTAMAEYANKLNTQDRSTDAHDLILLSTMLKKSIINFERKANFNNDACKEFVNECHSHIKQTKLDNHNSKIIKGFVKVFLALLANLLIIPAIINGGFFTISRGTKREEFANDCEKALSVLHKD